MTKVVLSYPPMNGTVQLKDEGVPDQKDLGITHKANKTYHFCFYALWIIEVLLMFRLILKLLGANPDNIFTLGIYGATYLLVLPFKNIFPPIVSTGTETIKKVFENSTLFAMFVYAIVVWSIAKFIIIKESKPLHR